MTLTLKDINFNIAMYGTEPVVQSTYSVVYTGDESSVKVNFNVTDETDLTGATAKVHLYFADSSHIEKDAKIDGKVVHYTLKGTENDHAGPVRVDVFITMNGATYTRAGYKFRIDQSLEASAPLVEYAIETLDTVIEGADEWLAQAQTDFGTAQNQRAAEWVADNDTRDDQFTAAQVSRTESFGQSETDRTVAFNASETGRSNTFTTNENARQAAADANETARNNSYTVAENDREERYGIAESNRSATADADHTRAVGDHNTATADHGIAESDHVTATADHENYAGLLEDGVLTTQIVDKLTKLETTYAPDLVSVKQQLADTLNKSAITLTHMFADNTARDAYFVAHPTELIELQFVKVGTGYQQYIEGVWTASTPIVAEQLSATNQPIVDTGNYFAIDKTNDALQELGAHKASTSNPHGVTKSQVGLGNADNTSDANKPISTATQAALNLKADKTTTDGLNTRLTAEETATANNKISAVKGKTFADVDARIEELETQAITVDARTEFEARNLITNGDFSNGATTGWLGYMASVTNENGKLKVTATVAGPYAQTYMTLSTIVGNKYYIRQYYPPGTASPSIVNPAVSSASSSTFTATQVSTQIKYSSGTVVIGDYYYIDDVILIDLTATFGAGKEPTLAEMDRMMARFPNSWFDGVKPIQTIETLYQEKANIAQPSIIAPTLTNGWLGNSTYYGYYKNTIGEVVLAGSLKSGTLGASAFTLPVGYRPSQTIKRACVSNNAFGYVEIGTDGTVKLYGSNAFVEIGSVSFRTDV